MKTQGTVFTLLTVLALAAAPRPCSAIVGFVNEPFQVGPNFFDNPLLAANNTLTALIPSAPEGTTVSLWNGTAYTPSATFSGGVWSGNFSILPGTGALLIAPGAFTNTFIGGVLDASGLSFDGITVHLPAPFSGPNGLYLWSNKLPVAAGVEYGYSMFQMVVGRGPNESEAFYRWNGSAFVGTTFHSGAWNNGEPFLNVGESGFFDIGGTGLLPTIPEPGSLTLLALGLACVIRKRLRR